MNMDKFKSAEGIIRNLELYKKMLSDLESGARPSIMIGASNFIPDSAFSVMLIQFCKERIAALEKEFELL